LGRSIREELEDIERRILSPKAALSADSLGRVKPEKPHAFRTAFQRDRDRIIHSKSFRRLKHKTQVFLAPFGDHFRTRLTHTLEVSQIARTIARALRLNEDLTEAIALGHDLGHTPFGHAGEDTLNSLLPGGFTHYEQSLRVVEKLEYEGRGLNLTFEVRDGIRRHSKGRGEILENRPRDKSRTLEGQIVRVSDVIAYVNHDIDDALRAGIIKEGDIPAHLVRALGRWPAIRVDRMVEDVVTASLECDLERICMSPNAIRAVSELRDFLYERVYGSPFANEEVEKAKKILTDLFQAVLNDPAHYVKPFPQEDPVIRRAADFIAGMTDLYALALYQKLFFPRSWSD
jgi:dGTPase